MKHKEAKTYVRDGKTITIIPAKKVKKMDEKTVAPAAEEGKAAPEKKRKKSETVKVPVTYAVGDKVSLKTIPAQYAGAGFATSVVVKVFKSTLDQQYRYSIRSASGQELALLPAEDLKPRK